VFPFVDVYTGPDHGAAKNLVVVPERATTTLDTAPPGGDFRAHWKPPPGLGSRR
jgi:hypothetical protein